MLLTTEEIFRLIVSLVILKKKMDDQFIAAKVTDEILILVFKYVWKYGSI